jgi:hypothetical protein
LFSARYFLPNCKIQFEGTPRALLAWRCRGSLPRRIQSRSCSCDHVTCASPDLPLVSPLLPRCPSVSFSGCTSPTTESNVRFQQVHPSRLVWLSTFLTGACARNTHIHTHVYTHSTHTCTRVHAQHTRAFTQTHTHTHTHTHNYQQV